MPVAVVARPPALGGVGFVTQMVGHLHLEAGLEHLAHQRRQQPVVASQLDALAAGPLDETESEEVVVTVVILPSPRLSVADPRITPGYTRRRTVPLVTKSVGSVA